MEMLNYITIFKSRYYNNILTYMVTNDIESRWLDNYIKNINSNQKDNLLEINSDIITEKNLETEITQTDTTQERKILNNHNEIFSDTSI